MTRERFLENRGFPTKAVAEASALPWRTNSLSRVLLPGFMVFPQRAARAAVLGALLPSASALLDSPLRNDLSRIASQYYSVNQEDHNDVHRFLAFLIKLSLEEKNADHLLHLSSLRQILQAIYGKQPTVLVDMVDGGQTALEASRFTAHVIGIAESILAEAALRLLLVDAVEYGRTLAKEITFSGELVRRRAERVLRKYFPNDINGWKPYAYILVRAVQCPSCHTLIHLAETPAVLEVGNTSCVLRSVVRGGKDGWRAGFSVSMTEVPTQAQGLAHGTCWRCGYQLSEDDERKLLAEQQGGADDALLAAVIVLDGKGKKHARDVELRDQQVRQQAIEDEAKNGHQPWYDEPHPFPSLAAYGITSAKDLLSSRQRLVIKAFLSAIEKVVEAIAARQGDDFARAVARAHLLAFAGMLNFQTAFTTYTRYGLYPFGAAKQITPPGLFAEINPLLLKLRGTWDYCVHEIAQEVARASLLSCGRGIVLAAPHDEFCDGEKGHVEEWTGADLVVADAQAPFARARAERSLAALSFVRDAFARLAGVLWHTREPVGASTSMQAGKAGPSSGAASSGLSSAQAQHEEDELAVGLMRNGQNDQQQLSWTQAVRKRLAAYRHCLSENGVALFVAPIMREELHQRYLELIEEQFIITGERTIKHSFWNSEEQRQWAIIIARPRNE